MQIVVVPVGHGNLGSLRMHLQRLGHSVEVWESMSSAERPDWVVIPGVGSMRGAKQRLRETGVWDRVRQWRTDRVPVLGICLGMQLFYEVGEEGGEGLAWMAGRVPRLDAPVLPHIGWNELQATFHAPAWVRPFHGVDVYFVHEFAVRPDDSRSVAMTTTYGSSTFPSVVWDRGLVGLQFHPELSGDVGEALTEQLLLRGA